MGAVGVTGPAPVELALDEGRRVRLHCADIGLACCAVEYVAATARAGVPPPEGDGPAPVTDVLVVSGTVTDVTAPAVRRLYEALDPPPRVVAFGACATSGGPYWDSYSVLKGVDQVVPVDLYVPGCPPRPEALLQGLLRLLPVGTGSGG